MNLNGATPESILHASPTNEKSASRFRATLPAQRHLLPPMTVPTSPRARVALALFSLYVIWGSTFLAIRYALGSFPPLLLAGGRFLLAGGLFYVILRARGAPRPTLREWRGALIVGTLLCCANGCVVLAEQWVSSGIAAVALASVPLWAALFAGLWGRWPSRLEWVGLGIGLLGVALLQSGGALRASPLGAVLLTASTVSWALGSMWSRKLTLPKGLMASAAEMLCGGAVLMTLSVLHGEHFAAVPTAPAMAAFLYLVTFGSIVGYTAYAYLLTNVRPALATSYAYVNPVVAVGLGAGFLHEAVAPNAVGALALILGGVALVMFQRTA